jgi:hypothetical protein
MTLFAYCFSIFFSVGIKGSGTANDKLKLDVSSPSQSHLSFRQFNFFFSPLRLQLSTMIQLGAKYGRPTVQAKNSDVEITDFGLLSKKKKGSFILTKTLFFSSSPQRHQNSRRRIVVLRHFY